MVGDVIEVSPSMFSTVGSMASKGDRGGIRYYSTEWTYLVGSATEPLGELNINTLRSCVKESHRVHQIRVPFIWLKPNTTSIDVSICRPSCFAFCARQQPIA